MNFVPAYCKALDLIFMHRACYRAMTEHYRGDSAPEAAVIRAALRYAHERTDEDIDALFALLCAAIFFATLTGGLSNGTSNNSDVCRDH